jgi:hypothetical protein
MRTSNGDLTDVYNSCMRSLGDAEYCAGVVESVVDAASRWIYTYVPEDRARPRFHIIRTHSDYVVKIYVDPNKKSLVLVLEGLRHSIQLSYKKEDGRFVLKSGMIVSLETNALNSDYVEFPLSVLLSVLVGIGAGVIPTVKENLTNIYNSCMRSLNDVEYCSGVVGAVVDAASRWVYTCVPEGRTKPRVHIIRTHSVYGIDVYVDKYKEGVIVVLDGRGHSIHLFYKREGDKFVLRRGVIHTLGTVALTNSYFEPPLGASKSSVGGL